MKNVHWIIGEGFHDWIKQNGNYLVISLYYVLNFLQYGSNLPDEKEHIRWINGENRFTTEVVFVFW